VRGKIYLKISKKKKTKIIIWLKEHVWKKNEPSSVSIFCLFF
jgi:hypothetical protein